MLLICCFPPARNVNNPRLGEAKACLRRITRTETSRLPASLHRTHPARPIVAWVIELKVMNEWRGPDSNRRHPGFQPSALPAELPRRGWAAVSVARPAAGHVSLRAVSADESQPRDRRDRRDARSRCRAARRRHGTVRDPLRGARAAAHGEARCACLGRGERHLPRRGDGRGRRRARALPPPDPRPLRSCRAARRGGGTSRCHAARSRRRSLGRARLARRDGAGTRARRRGLWSTRTAIVNTPETSPTGNVHGMVLAAALGLAGDAFRRDGWQIPAVDSGKLALVGVRSLDEGERELLGSASTQRCSR